MKIYTKTGDDGSSALFGGQRVSKNSSRLEAYGNVDELNSFIGLSRAFVLADINENFAEQIQNYLFVLGADLATPPNKKNIIARIGPSHIEILENYIDQIDSKLEALKHFILPGGTNSSASLHCARTICRRTERSVVNAIQNGEEISEDVIIFLNRLSDLIFVMARYENLNNGISELKWQPR